LCKCCSSTTNVSSFLPSSWVPIKWILGLK
jgi:hypothetical protein